MSLHYIKTTPAYYKIIEEIYSEKLGLGLPVSMAVSTNSMFPTIMAGSVITFEKKDKYKEGDVVVLKESNGFIVHRIVKINKNIVVTCGDNNFRDDDFTSIKNILGKVVNVTGNKRSLYSYYSQLQIKIRKFFNFIFIKLKNTVFALSDNFLVKLLLLFLYKIQIFVVKTYFKLFEKENNLYLRGSAMSGKIKPGLSDIDFVVLTKKSPDNKSLVNSMGKLSSLTPVISFNSFLPIDVYAKLLKFEMLEDYNSYGSKKLSGNMDVQVDKSIADENLVILQRVIENIDYVDDIMFKFSQMKHYHPSYLFHNIKKLFYKLFVLNDIKNEFVDFITFLETKNRYKTLHLDIEEYSKALSRIIQKIDLPSHSLPNLDFSKMSDVVINGKEVKIFTEVRRYKSYILEDGFTHEDIHQLIKYTVEENTYPYFCGIMTKEIANYLQIYNIKFLLEKDFELKEQVTIKYLCDSIKLFNNYQIIKMKDRNTIIGTARDIVILCNSLALRANKDFKIPDELHHFTIDQDIDGGLDATAIYFKYIQQLNELFLKVV
jgi:signal peptidase I